MVCRMWTSGEWNKMSRRGKVLKLVIILESFCHVKQVHLIEKIAPILTKRIHDSSHAIWNIYNTRSWLVLSPVLEIA